MRHDSELGLDSDRRLLARASIGLWLGLFAVPSAVSAAAEPSASLQVVDGGDCLTSEAIEREVHERSQRIQFVTAAADVPQLTVRLTRGRELSAQLSIVWPDARRSERRMAAASCAEASSAVAFLIALTLDPQAVSSTPAPRSTEPAPPTAAAPPVAAAAAEATQDASQPAVAATAEKPAPAAEVTPESSSPDAGTPTPSPFAVDHVSVGLRLEFATGVAPNPMLGPGLQVLVELRGSGLWAPALQLSAAHIWASGIEVEGSGVADFQLSLVRLGLCPAGVRLGPVTGRLCVTSAGGSLNAQGSGSYNPDHSARGWFDLGANLHLLAPLGSLYLEGAAGFVAPLRRDKYEFYPMEFHQVAAVCWQGQLGAGVRFP